MGNSQSLQSAKKLLGKEVEVTFDRPLGTKHLKHGFIYEANYGYIEGIKAPDGEDLDAYYLGVDKPLTKERGICIAIAHRKNNDDDKLVVVPEGVSMTDDEIMKAIHFQEQWFDTEIVRIKTIKFADNLSMMILNGEKTTTWRLFDDKNLTTGDIVDFVNSETKERFGSAELVEVYEKNMQDLNDTDAEGHEPINSLSEIYERYKMYYPNQVIDGNTKIKIIKFSFEK